MDAITLGESLGLVMGEPASPLRAGSAARFSFAGAESNVAIGLARLGHAVGYVTRVGDDFVGRTITETLAGEGVDVPVGAGDEALRRIEAGLVADDPHLVESFRCWQLPGGEPDDDGTARVGGWTLLVLAVGLAQLMAGPTGLLIAVLLVSVRVCRGRW